MIKESIQTDSNISSMRIVLLIDIIACVGLAVMAILMDRDLTGTALLVAALLAPVSISKAVQAKYE